MPLLFFTDIYYLIQRYAVISYVAIFNGVIFFCPNSKIAGCQFNTNAAW